MKYLILTFCILTVFKSSGQFTIHGSITDSSTKETLISAHVYDSISMKSAISNSQGFYSLTLNRGKVSVRVKYLGYEESVHTFHLVADTVINFKLLSKSEQLNDVKIVAEVPIHEQTLLGKNIISKVAIENGPSSFGELDLMKAATKLPGITPGREGRSNIYVRGGDRGQNLILLDGVKLYNTGHMGGFVSLFNTDVIKQVDVYKGGYPSRFGGRASSVIDIHTLDGNRNKLSGKFNLGLLTSSVMAEGPIGEKISFVVAARTSYYELYSLSDRNRMKKYSTADFVNFNFFDINAKLTYYINPRNRVYGSLFIGNDRNVTKYRSPYEIGNTLYAIKNSSFKGGIHTELGTNLFIKNSVSYSNYSNELNSSNSDKRKGTKITSNYFSTSEIKEFNLQSKLEYYPNSSHAIKAGVEYSYYKFLPGVNRSYKNQSDTGFERDTTFGYRFYLEANEIAAFAEDEIQFNKQLFLNIGLREVLFLTDGKNYNRTEPRVSLRAMLNNNLSLKANWTIMNQFNHVVVSNYGLFEKEMWMASTKDIPPQQAQQYAVGLFATLPSAKLQFSTELYYKTMTNLLEYKIPVDVEFVVSDINETIVKNGKGEAYGAEFLAAYKNERFAIDFSYALSWNYRQFDDLNNGKKYPFIYDRRHDFSITTTTLLGSHYSINSNFVFSTGTPYTMPDGYVKYDDYMYNYYAYRGMNNKRLPNYHRLDLSLVKKSTTRKGKNETWRLNIFNAYARQNPLIIYYDQKTGKVYGKSMFSIVPTISYSLEF